MSTDSLRLNASEFIVEKFPERAGGELAGVFLDVSEWEPGIPIEIDVSHLPPELLITSFFATFMRFLHQEDSNFCSAAVNDITWITEHGFQQNNIQSWMEPWKRIAMNKHTISNTGRDEEGREIGNCSCGATGVDVDAHLRTVAIQSVSKPKKIEPSNLFPERGETVTMPVAYEDVNKLREMYPSKPHDLARYDGNIVEVISYPSPPAKEDLEEWARLGGKGNSYELVYPQATVLVRLIPGEPTTVREVYCFQVESVPHEDDDGRMKHPVDTGKELKQLVMSWWIFYRLDEIPHLESPKELLGIMNEFLADPVKCDEELSKGYSEYGPPMNETVVAIPLNE